MFHSGTAKRVGAVAALLLGLSAPSASAQLRQVAPVPGAAPESAERMTLGMLEGAVKEVDPGSGTLAVSSGPFGIFQKTLEVTGDTVIQVEGRQGNLSDIRPGETVKASYEVHETKNVATRIDVVPAQPGAR